MKGGRGLHWTDVAQDRDKCAAFVSMVMNFHVQ
jgi:hypothetical protein